MTEIALDGVLVDVGNKNDKYEKFPPTKLAWDIKGAGVASTVVQKQTDKFQNQDAWQRDHGHNIVGLPDPFSESLRGKRKLLHHSQLSKNSKALDRLKEKIQRQKDRSPAAAEKFSQPQRVQASSASFLEDTELCTRKIAKGPTAPKYKGFNSAVTRIKTVSSQPSRQATPSDLYVSRARNESKASDIRISRVEAPPKRTKVTARDGSSLERKTMITPSSWRQGQHIAESILGPAVKYPKQTRKYDAPASKPETKESGVRQARPSYRHDVSVPRAQGDEGSVVTRPLSAPPVARSVVKHKRPELDMEPEKDKQPKVRHYDQNAVQQYIVKKKEERKRKKSQERKAHKEAQAKKQKQLEELYRRQKKYAISKKRPLAEDENCPPDDATTLTKPTMQSRDDIGEIAGTEEYGSLSRFDQRATEIMERLTSFAPRSTAVKPTFGNEDSNLGSKSVSVKLAPTLTDDSHDNMPSTMAKESAPSEFMRKLDQYLDESRAGFEGFGKQTSSRSAHVYSDLPDLTRNEFGVGVGRSTTYSTGFHDHSPSASWAKKSSDDRSPSQEYLSTVRMKAERIAALKSRADTLNDKMEVAMKLVEQPILPTSRNLDDVDKFLRTDYAVPSSSSLPNVDEILRKYDVELSLPSLPGSNLRSNWPVTMQNSVSKDPVTTPKKHANHELELESNPDPALSEPVMEPSFSSRLRSLEKVSDPLSSHALSQGSDDDEIHSESEQVDEYQSHNMDNFDKGEEDFGKISKRSCHSPTMKTGASKAPWESLGDKHSIINLCVGRILKDKEGKHRVEQPVDVPESRSCKDDIRIVDGAGMETEDSFTSTISKDISPASTPKKVIPKKHFDDITQPSLKRTKLPQMVSSPAPVTSLPSVDEFDTRPVTSSRRSDKIDQETVHDADETRGMERLPMDDTAPLYTNFTKHTTRHTNDYTQKFSPAALEQKLLAELNYQDSIDETLRHLTGVEKTQSTSAAQQDSVSLAQLVKTQQLLHGFELEKERVKALAKIRQQAPTDPRKGASPRSIGSRSRTTDSASSPAEKEFISHKNSQSSIFNDSHFSSSSSLESVPEDLPSANKDEHAAAPTPRKETISDKCASDESERSPYDKKRPVRKFGHGHSYQTEKSPKHKNDAPSISTDITSDSSVTSVHFDESVTEDEMQEISLRAVVASEGHRRRHRSRSNGPLKKFEEGYENLKASHAMERGNEKNSEFFQFMDELVQRYMQEEEFRTHHQEAMLHLRKRAIKEKTEAELTMLKRMKKQARKKGEDEKMPPLEKKQRAILRRYKMENAEIKKLKAMAKVADQERKHFIQQNVGRRGKRDEYGDSAAGISDGVPKESIEKLDTTSPDVADHDNSSIADSNSDISTSSSVLMKKLKSNAKAFDGQKLTKREQLLMKRKKQAEQLIAWKKRLDREEEQVCSIEKKALRTWDKDISAKQGKKKTQEKDSDPDASSDSNMNTAPSLTESSIAEEIASGTADSSASQSVVSPSLPSRGDVRTRSSSSETIQEDDSQYSDFPLETQDVTKPKLESNEKSPTDSKPKTTTRSDQTVDAKPTADGKRPGTSRKDSLETWSDESISQTPSETEQSDIECRVRALREELNRRRLIAERLKKKQKQRHKDRLKAQEASLRSQIEAYDIFIRKTQDELKQELGSQPTGVVAKPQIRSPQKNHQGRQQLLQSSIGSSETSGLAGHVTLAGIAYQRSESESSDKSRTNEDEEMPIDASPSGSVKSGVHDKPESAIPKFNKQMTTGGISRSLFSTGAKPRSLIPIPSRNSTSPKFPSTIPSQPKEPTQEEAIVKKSLDSDVSSPVVSEKKLLESDDDISEHIDEISNVSSEKHSSVDQLPLLDLNESKALSSTEETTSGGRKEEKEETLTTSPVTSPLEAKSREDLLPFKIGDKVVVAGRDTGVVRFVGEASFAKGIWVGVELQSTIGKNDGSVNGIRYFTCSPNRGIFAPPAKIALVSDFSVLPPISPKKDNILDFEKPTHESESESSSSLSSQKDDSLPTEPTAEKSERKEKNKKLADRLTSGLFDSLLGDSMDHILHQYSESKSRNEEEQKDLDDAESESQSPLQREPHDGTKPTPDQDDKPDVNVKRRSNLAETFSDDLFRDTVEKVIEIRKQRAKKWSSQDVQEEYDNIRSPADGKLDYGKEVEDILGMNNRMVDDDSDTDDKDSMTPVRPVSPVLGGQDEWIEDDISACLAKPIVARENVDNEIWKDGRFIEALSDFFEPSPIPKEFAVDHDPDQILKLVENTVSAFYSRHAKGEEIDTFVPDVIFDEKPKKTDEDDISKTIDVTVKKKQDVDANHVFNMSLIDMVREFMMEVFACKNRMEARSTIPKWQKKRVSNGPMYKKIPKTEEEFQTYVTKKVSKLLNLHGSMNKRNPRVGMKWGSQKKDRVDVILIRELREEEPDWTNYDEDETTVKMQLTDTILDLLLSDSIHCLNEIHSKKMQSCQNESHKIC